MGTVCTPEYVPSSFELDEKIAEIEATFLNYRYDLLVSHGGGNYTVPGYFDGEKFTAIWAPKHSLRTTLTYRFCEGIGIAIVEENKLNPSLCKTIISTFGVGDVSFGQCAVTTRGSRYLRRGDGRIFLKTGAGSLENIITYTTPNAPPRQLDTFNPL